VSDLTIDYAGLASLKSKARKYRRKLRKLSAASVARMLALALGLAVLPFVLLIRGGVLIYESCALGNWPSLLLSAFATVCLLAAYAWAAVKRQFHKGRDGNWEPNALGAHLAGGGE